MQHCQAGESQGGRCALLFSLVEVKQYFILLKSLCETPRPRIMLAIIKPIFAETEKNITEHLPSTRRSYSSKRCWKMHTHTNIVWLETSSTFVSNPAARGGGGHSHPSWPLPCAQDSPGVTLTVPGFMPGDFKEAELPEEITARCGTLAALCTGWERQYLPSEIAGV